MGLPQCNTTEEYERIDEEPIWKGMQFHHFGLILSALFGSIAILVSLYLIWRHATHYLKPWEQRQIIRILFMVPIYATVSFLSYYFYRHAIYFEVMRDCYEALAIASFFALLCHYIAPDLRSQKEYFRGVAVRNWVWPLRWIQPLSGGTETGLFRKPKSGLTAFNIIWFAVFQYCFIRVFMTGVAVITQAAGRYCLETLNPAFAHIWVLLVEAACVMVAMYCLIQFYFQTKDDIAEHQPLLKIAAIKLVIFLSFWQTLLISFLTSLKAIKPSRRFQFPDIKIGIPAMLLCIEMAIFAIFHLWAFPWKVYDVRRSDIVAAESAAGFMHDPKTAYQGGRFGERALMDAFNPWDLVKAVGRGFRWAAVGRKRRHEDISYQNGGNKPGLEPTRNQFTAFSGSRDQGSTAYQPTTTTSNNYYADDDHDRLLQHAAANPESQTYPRPMSTHHPRKLALSPSHSPKGSVSQFQRSPYMERSPYMDSSGHLAPSISNNQSAEYGIVSDSPSIGSDGYQSRKVSGESGHRRDNSATPSVTLQPDETPLGPPGRKSSEHAEWQKYGGRGQGQDERDLGGGHGVGDNRF